MKRLESLGLLVVLAMRLSAQSNESGYVSLQSGTAGGGTPVHNRGILGQGQVIAILDTGLDWDSCWFSEPDGSPPPVNLTIDGRVVDANRRKVIAYDFLYSCIEWPLSASCEVPLDASAWDNQGHGTHAAAGAAADKGAMLAHDFGDALAPGAKLVIQDGGYIGGDNCAQRPGFGCPLRDLRPVLRQAYEQGARVHSSSWGDRQGVAPPANPPTGNYSTGARDIDAFVYEKPDMVVVFNTGNAGELGAMSQSSPGNAKNTIQVGGSSFATPLLHAVASYSGIGPTRDQRIKPDLVGPLNVYGADSDLSVGTANCDGSYQGGTSFASPPVAAAAALVRQYYLEGWYPTGARVASNAIAPSAALVKATLIGGARLVPYWNSASGTVTIDAVPSYEQGFGFPVLDDALYFAGDRARLFVRDRSLADGLKVEESEELIFDVASTEELRVALVWTDPPGTPAGFTSSTQQLVNDLDVVVVEPSGTTHYGNEQLHPGARETRNNAEVVRVASPASGRWKVRVEAPRLGLGPRQGWALVVIGDLHESVAQTRRRPVRPGS
ncbi:MAG: S8 family serine peptidase [Acidobacteria bacterium]|nr:S8 family serine peptidase [Acidobacteriota bacterium]